MRIRNLFIVCGVVLGLLSVGAWSVGNISVSLKSTLGSFVFGGEYYLTSPQDIQTNVDDLKVNHDISVYKNKVAWCEDWDGDPTNYYHSHIVVYDLETREYQYVNYTPDVVEMGGGGMSNPILTDDYVFFYLMTGTGLSLTPTIMMHSLESIVADNDYGGWEWYSGIYTPSEYDTIDANNDYMVWVSAGSGLCTLNLDNMTVTNYPLGMDYGAYACPSISEDNVVYYNAFSWVDITRYNHIDSIDLETGIVTQVTDETLSDGEIFGTAYGNNLWWQNTTTTTGWENKWDSQLLNVHTNETLYDTDVPRFNMSEDDEGEWAYPMAVYEDMGLFIDETTFGDGYQENLTLVNFKTGEGLVLEVFVDTDNPSCYQIYRDGFSPIRNQMVYMCPNGTYIITTEGGVYIQYLIPVGLAQPHILNDKEALTLQQERRDFWLLGGGFVILISTAVYAYVSKGDTYYEGR